jgi:ABC-type Fe3+/spermidine/putrescine transport system ATPase subunit/ABC-type sulfate transport system permease component
VTRRLPAPLPWLAGLLAVYLLGPFLAGIPQVWSADWHSVDTAALGRACVVSVASATSALIALGGIPLGYLLARTPGRAAAMLGFLVQLPLALPPLASGILLLFLLGYRSPLGRLTDGGLTDSFVGIVLAEIFVAAPFLIVAARSAFAAVDPVLEGVAATLGHHRLAVFLRVSLPLAWPATRSGLLLAWLRGFGEFGATVMVAYHPYSLPVYTYVTFGSQGLPAMLPVLLPALAAAVIVMGLSSASTRRASIRGGRAAVPQAAPLVHSVDRSNRHSRPRNTTALPVELAFRLQKQLNGFELDIACSTRARRIGILGPSGSGKSLTLRLIAGLERPDVGTLTLGGRDLLKSPPELRSIAYVPQNYGLFPNLTIAEHLRFPIGAAPDMAQHWLERLGLSELKDRRPTMLSLGQQQRVALARALVRPADLLLLDEPFSALDTPLRARLRHELRDLQREIAATTIIVTHDPQEVALLADELLVLEDGRVLQAGPIEAIFSRPASEAVARLLGAENVGEGIAVAENQIAIEGGAIVIVAGPALQPGKRVGWSVRPECLRLSTNGRHEATIESSATIGGAREISVRLGGTLLRVRAGLEDGAVTSRCRLDIDPGSVQVWETWRAVHHAAVPAQAARDWGVGGGPR